MKQITIKGQKLSKKIEVIGSIFFGQLSEIEMRVLIELISLNEPQINLTPMVSKSIKECLGLNDSTFNVTLSRLHKKNAINKSKSVILLSPVLNGLSGTNEWVIKFVTAE